MKLLYGPSSLLYKFTRLVVPVLIFILFFTFRLPGLGYDLSNSDALRWHSRSEEFLTAIKTGDFIQTYQQYQPGVTLMWLSAGIKQVTYTYQLRGNSDYFPIIDGSIRRVLVIVLALLLVFHAYIVFKIFGYSTSLIYSLLMSVEPYLIGIDRWLHLSSLETYLSFAAFLALFYWGKTRKREFFCFSTVAFALGVLSKFTAVAILPVLIFLIVFFTYREKHTVIGVLKPLIVYGVTSFMIFVALFPAMWVQPLFVMNKLISAGTQAVQSASFSEIVPPDLNGLNPVTYYGVILALKLSPITLVLFLLGILKVRKTKDLPFVFFYFLTAFLVLTIAAKKIDRYAIFLFPPILLMASTALNSMRSKYIVIFGALLFIIFVSYIYFPIYSAYNSPIFGGTAGSRKIGVYDNSGEYFSNAAFYLNTLSRDNVVFVPNNIDSFSPFYKGKLTRKFDSNVDYVVSSVDMYRSLPNSSLCPTLDRSFGPRDAKVVFVYKCLK